MTFIAFTRPAPLVTGQHLDHQAIQQAIDRVVEQGGGTVVVLVGHDRCGSIRLQGHVYLDR